MGLTGLWCGRHRRDGLGQAERRALLRHGRCTANACMRVSWQEKLFVLVLLSLMAVGVHFLTVVRMGVKSALEKQPTPFETSRR